MDTRPCEPIHAASDLEAVEGLYVHVPFCVRKCHYCDFYSLATGPGDPDANGFLEALTAELSRVPAGFSPRTIFIGGGTPTELSARDLERLLTLLRDRVDRSRLVEWTCEANPGTLSREKARLLLAAGVDRVSLGVQSFDDRVLRFLGRIHDARQAEAGAELLRELGCTNLNLDLISAVPGAPPERLGRDLARAIRIAPEHVSCYTLMFEEGTPLEALRRRGAVRPIDEEAELTEFRLAREQLCGAGYLHYEVSNFCRAEPGRDLRSRHNLLYWGAGQYIGIGPGAHSHVAKRRYGNARDLTRWTEAQRSVGGQAAKPADALAVTERLEPRAWAREALVMWLRQLDGVERSAFLDRTGFDYRELYRRADGEDPLTRLIATGLLEDDGARLQLSERGLCVADPVFAELI
jgi:oxygen-independent coproporphyrinogen-3 oxidase